MMIQDFLDLLVAINSHYDINSQKNTNLKIQNNFKKTYSIFSYLMFSQTELLALKEEV